MHKYFGEWLKVIDSKILNTTLQKLDKEYKVKSILPLKNEVFKAFNLCNYNDLKIVIIGQDFGNKL